MNVTMSSFEYRAESHVMDRLERENAQLKAVIAEVVGELVDSGFRQIDWVKSRL